MLLFMKQKMLPFTRKVPIPLFSPPSLSLHLLTLLFSGVLVSGILGRLQIIINQFDEPMFIFDPCNNTPAPSANTSYGAFFSSFKTYWRGKKDSVCNFVVA